MAGKLTNKQAKAQIQAVRFLRARRGAKLPPGVLPGALRPKPLQAGGSVQQSAVGGGGVNPIKTAQPAVSAGKASYLDDTTPWFSGPPS